MSRNRLRKLARDEEGFTLVFVALGLLAFLSVSMLAIDLGMLMTSRNQAQNSADASALAGATALVYDNWNDRTPTGPAVQNALTAARANQVMGAAPAIAPSDVVFLNDPSGTSNRVQSTVYRDAAHGNPMPTFIAKYFGTATVNIAAVATAEASPANAVSCVKPWTIPDKWQEANPPFDPQTSTFDPTTGDVYIPIDQSGYTGYGTSDIGTMVTLKPDNGSNTAPSFYNEWAIPPGRGGNWYRDNIATCNTYIQPIGDLLTMEPGNKVGPTVQGTTTLIDSDPNAYWDSSCNCVKGSAFSRSPRIVTIPTYDPVYYYNGKHNGRNASLKVANWIGVFVASVDSSSNVTGYIAPVSGLLQGGGGPAPAGVFPKVIRLVQ